MTPPAPPNTHLGRNTGRLEAVCGFPLHRPLFTLMNAIILWVAALGIAAVFQRREQGLAQGERLTDREYFKASLTQPTALLYIGSRVPRRLHGEALQIGLCAIFAVSLVSAKERHAT